MPPPGPTSRYRRAQERLQLLRWAVASVAVILLGAAIALAAVEIDHHHHNSPSSTPGTSAGQTASGGSAVPQSPLVRGSSEPPQLLVAVTSAGAVEVVDSTSGKPVRTLVQSGAIGDEVAVSPNAKTVYFETQSGCDGEIDSVPVAGGATTQVVQGSLPAISPNGTLLAYASEPDLSQSGCGGSGNIATHFAVMVRNLSTGSEHRYPMAPAYVHDGLPAPILHLSWETDNKRLFVSISSAEDNEGWNLVAFNVDSNKYYDATNTFSVPVTGTNASASYYREGVAIPNGNVFVARYCCTGITAGTTSILMQEVDTFGHLVHQIAVGVASRVHQSLDVDPSGRWFLYLSGPDLYVSDNGADPNLLATGFVAAAW